VLGALRPIVSSALDIAYEPSTFKGAATSSIVVFDIHDRFRGADVVCGEFLPFPEDLRRRAIHLRVQLHGPPPRPALRGCYDVRVVDNGGSGSVV
jgi:hypothetical protein